MTANCSLHRGLGSKVFPTLTDAAGHTLKYLQPQGVCPRLFFPLTTLQQTVNSSAPLWLIEGEKKALAVAQLGLPAVGFAGIEAWHVAGSRELLPDFDFVPLAGRLVELTPDGDHETNAAVRRGAERFGEALRDQGARPRLVKVPRSLAA